MKGLAPDISTKHKENCDKLRKVFDTMIKYYNPTVKYNNGEVYTNHWSDWSGKSKITGEVQKNTFHCWWQWDGDKIVATQCYFDTSDIMAETKLYQEQNSQ